MRTPRQILAPKRSEADAFRAIAPLLDAIGEHGMADDARYFAARGGIQVACDHCTQGVMDADGPAGAGNDHLYGRCKCECHCG